MTRNVFLQLLFCGFLGMPVGAFQQTRSGGSFNWLDKIAEGKEMLTDVQLKHSSKIVTYKQVIRPAPSRKRNNKKRKPVRQAHGKPKPIIRTYKDYAWKEIGLAVMNTSTAEIKIVKIRKEGQKLINLLSQNKGESSLAVAIEERPSGLTWNGRNTAYRVVNRIGWVVVANKWLERQANGKPKETIYVPHSSGIHVNYLIEAGNKHLRSDIEQALDWLDNFSTKSLVLPNKNVGHLVPPEYLKNLVLNEHTDTQEFYAFLSGNWDINPFDRVLVLIGANGNVAYPSGPNYAGARGLVQFTNNSRKKGGLGTWDFIKKTFPSAELPSFESGSGDHGESIMAAALLYDYNLSRLVKALGERVVKDSNLQDYLTAAHNCGVERVIKAIQNGGHDWRQALRKLGKTNETIDYLEKLDYLKQNPR